MVLAARMRPQTVYCLPMCRWLVSPLGVRRLIMFMFRFAVSFFLFFVLCVLLYFVCLLFLFEMFTNVNEIRAPGKHIYWQKFQMFIKRTELPGVGAYCCEAVSYSFFLFSCPSTFTSVRKLLTCLKRLQETMFIPDESSRWVKGQALSGGINTADLVLLTLTL